ncbi:MAG: hypothetical protein H8E31_08710 [Planctomycetes bacterium]|nr:hypothetical protein [Planctomycetota bacterium]
MLFLKRCIECRKKLEPGANFCSCGSPVQDFRRTCNHCHRIVPFEGEACGHCGARLEEIDARFVLVRWSRRGGEFARRIEIAEFSEGGDLTSDPRDALQGALNGGVVVDQGTRALLLVDGRVAEDLGPGWTSTTNDALSAYAGDQYIHTLTVIAVDAGDTELSWSFPAGGQAERAGSLGVSTQDGFLVGFHVQLAVSLRDAAALATNLLKDANSLTPGQLSAWLRGPLEAVVRDFIQSSLAKDLVRLDAGARSRLETSLREGLGRALGVVGLGFDGLRGFEIESERLGEIQAGEEGLAANKEKARQAEAGLDDLGKLQKALAAEHRISDETLFEIEKSKLLTEAQVAEIRRCLEDEKSGWIRANEIIQKEHEVKLRALAADADLREFVDLEKARIDIDELRATNAEDRERRKREHETEISIKLLEAKQRGKRELLSQMSGTEDPELVLALLSSVSPDAAEALKARYQSASAEQQVELLKEGIRLAKAGQHEELERMAGLHKDSMRDMADVAAAKATTNLVPCPHCRTNVPLEVAECPACRSALK